MEACNNILLEGEGLVSTYWGDTLVTRSQAVATIADRTAKNCRGHVT